MILTLELPVDNEAAWRDLSTLLDPARLDALIPHEVLGDDRALTTPVPSLTMKIISMRVIRKDTLSFSFPSPVAPSNVFISAAGLEEPPQAPAVSVSQSVPQLRWMSVQAFFDRYPGVAPRELEDADLKAEILRQLDRQLEGRGEPPVESPRDLFTRFQEVGVLEGPEPPLAMVQGHLYVRGAPAIDEALNQTLTVSSLDDLQTLTVSFLDDLRLNIVPLPYLAPVERPGIVFQQGGWDLGRPVEELQGLAVVTLPAGVNEAVALIDQLRAEAIVAVLLDPKLFPNLWRLNALIVTLEDRPGHWVTAIFV